MKKLIIVGSCLLLVAGCSFDQTPDRTFEQAYDIWSNGGWGSMSGNSIYPKDRDSVSEQTTIDIKGTNPGTNLSVSVVIDADYALPTNIARSTMTRDLLMQDETNPSPTKLHVDLLTRTIGQSLYAQLSGFTIDMGTGNASATLIEGYMSSFADTWMSLDSTQMLGTSVSTDKSDISAMINDAIMSIQSSPILRSLGKQSVNGRIVFEIEQDPTGMRMLISKLLSYQQIQTSIYGTPVDLTQGEINAIADSIQLQGYMEVINNDTVRVSVESITFDENKQLMARGFFEPRQGLIELIDPLREQSYVLDWIIETPRLSRPKALVNLSIDERGTIIMAGSFEISPQLKLTNRQYDFEGEMRVMTPVYLSDTPSTFAVTVQGSTIFEQTDPFRVSVPDSPVDFADFFGTMMLRQNLEEQNDE